MSAAPIACMLSGNDFKERLKWLADLNRRALIGSDRDDLRLTLRYKTRALKQVRQLVEQEQACCPFLSFEVAKQSNAVVLVITAPEEARVAADTVFEPFVQTRPEKAGCGCCGNAA